MFHVEHFMKKLLFLCLALLLAACHKPEPNPELRDPIYSDLEAKKKELEGQISTEKKNLEEADGQIKKAVPQTGQIKFARKHYFEIKANLEKLQQLQKYYALRMESRKNEDQTEYLKAFEKDQPWPDPQEFDDYKTQESARFKKRTWNVKERIEQERALANPKPAGGEGGEGGGEKKE